MSQGVNKSLHPIFSLHLMDEIKAAEIDGPFNDNFSGGPCHVSVPEKFFSHFTKSI